MSVKAVFKIEKNIRLPSIFRELKGCWMCEAFLSTALAYSESAHSPNVVSNDDVQQVLARGHTSNPIPKKT